MRQTRSFLLVSHYLAIYKITYLNFLEKNKDNKTGLVQGRFELVREFLPRRGRLGAGGRRSGLSGESGSQ